MLEQSLLKNYVYNFIKTFCGIVFPILTFAYTSRVLGVDGLGKIIFSQSFITYFSMIAMLGINQYGTREAAKVRDDKRALSKFVHEILFINFITTLVAYIFLAIAIFFVKKLQDYETLLWINSFSIAMLGLGMEWLYQAVEEYGYIAKRAVLFQIIALAAMFLFVHDRDDVVVYAIISVFSASGSYILNFFNARKYIDFTPIGGYELKKHLASMLWLFARECKLFCVNLLD
ncbi:MAG: oligosaccharide flippase family protein [Lachnospiraceae bacterium]|nr:oligosaccharide flippase family protein [Lachnospiraceae bacterium]